MRCDGATFAKAWLAVALASGKDAKNDPAVLHRTVAIEEFLRGVRLVATDRTLLLTAWVPDLDYDADQEPGLDEAPDRVVVAHDGDGRARSLSGYVLALFNHLSEVDQEKPGAIEVEVRFDVRVPPGTMINGAQLDETLDGLEPRFVVLNVPDVERVYLPVVESEFPQWRSLVLGHRPRRTDRVALSPSIAERLCKVSRYAVGPLVWQFGGKDRAALVSYPDADPLVQGVFMPRKLEVEGHHDPDDNDDGGPGSDDGDDDSEGADARARLEVVR